MGNRLNETPDDNKARLKAAATHISELRENETDFEYNQRLTQQENYRKKVKKSKTKWQEWLEYNANWQREKRKNESFKAKRERLMKQIDYQKWKQGQSR